VRNRDSYEIPPFNSYQVNQAKTILLNENERKIYDIPAILFEFRLYSEVIALNKLKDELASRPPPSPPSRPKITSLKQQQLLSCKPLTVHIVDESYNRNMFNNPVQLTNITLKETFSMTHIRADVVLSANVVSNGTDNLGEIILGVTKLNITSDMGFLFSYGFQKANYEIQYLHEQWLQMDPLLSVIGEADDIDLLNISKKFSSLLLMKEPKSGSTLNLIIFKQGYKNILTAVPHLVSRNSNAPNSLFLKFNVYFCFNPIVLNGELYCAVVNKRNSFNNQNVMTHSVIMHNEQDFKDIEWLYYQAEIERCSSLMNGTKQINRSDYLILEAIEIVSGLPVQLSGERNIRTESFYHFNQSKKVDEDVQINNKICVCFVLDELAEYNTGSGKDIGSNVQHNNLQK
jgi:hypothetical protein